MYNNPFYIPIYNQTMMAPNLMRTFPAARALTTTTRATGTGGLFSRIGSSLTGIKSINWSGLINNTSKTLGIINQTIPVVRQVGPMVNNMKQMMRIASIFKDETDTKKIINNKNIFPQNKVSNNYQNNNQPRTNTNFQQNNNITNNLSDESPTFFINT